MGQYLEDSKCQGSNSPLGLVIIWSLPGRLLLSISLEYNILLKNKFYSTLPCYALQESALKQHTGNGFWRKHHPGLCY